MSNDLEKYQISKEIFDHVVSVTIHEDAKAGRIILSIAFLAGATSSVYGAFFGKGIRFMLYGRDLISLFFLLFVVCVVIGSFNIMNAVGPKFNIPKIWKKNNHNKSKSTSTGEYIPKSIYFFELIAEEDRSKWMSYFEAVEVNKLLQKASEDHVYEAYLVSEKIRDKVRSIRIAKFFFMVSILIFVIITFLGVTVIG